MSLDLEKILKELEPYRERKVKVRPKQAAFLAIDIQNYFHRIVQPILKNLLRVIQSCRQKDIPIIFTQHGHADPLTDGGVLGQGWGELILHGTKDWRFLPEIKMESKDTILSKKRYSAFYETDLDSIL
jgi:nicotinamidase-related amidase